MPALPSHTRMQGEQNLAQTSPLVFVQSMHCDFLTPSLHLQSSVYLLPTMEHVPWSTSNGFGALVEERAVSLAVRPALSAAATSSETQARDIPARTKEAAAKPILLLFNLHLHFFEAVVWIRRNNDATFPTWAHSPDGCRADRTRNALRSGFWSAVGYRWPSTLYGVPDQSKLEPDTAGNDSVSVRDFLSLSASIKRAIAGGARTWSERNVSTSRTASQERSRIVLRCHTTRPEEWVRQERDNHPGRAVSRG